MQARRPAARFVKAFSCVGNALMVNPKLPGGPADHVHLRQRRRGQARGRRILEQFGWENEDLGAAEAARAIEPLCMLWCIPGFRQNQWNHAFKLLRA